jgi:hypothetical protein
VDETTDNPNFTAIVAAECGSKYTAFAIGDVVEVAAYLPLEPTAFLLLSAVLLVVRNTRRSATSHPLSSNGSRGLMYNKKDSTEAGQLHLRWRPRNLSVKIAHLTRPPIRPFTTF